MALMRALSHDILQEILGTVYEFFCRIRIITPKVLVMMDGGICSQMHQYLIGQIYAEQGEKVGYDLSFYKKNGMDVERKMPRTFELEDMFPNIHVETFANKLEIGSIVCFCVIRLWIISCQKVAKLPFRQSFWRVTIRYQTTFL